MAFNNWDAARSNDQQAWGHKRKRRRIQERPPIAAHLVLDARLKGDVGILAERAFDELFPAVNEGQDRRDQVYYVAIAPQAPPAYRQSSSVAPWTVLAVTKQQPSSQNDPQQPILRFPAASNALYTFTQNLQKTSTNIARLALQSAINIQILDVVPIGLDTVVVSVDEPALAKLDAANHKFRKGTVSSGGSMRRRAHQRSTSVGDATGSPDRWEPAIRSALSAHHVLHTRDYLPLPLSAHPITHVAPPPAIVEMCEPVAQGIILPATRIVAIPMKLSADRIKQMLTSPTFSTVNGTVPEEDEDTANEQFFSAAEDRSPAGQAARASSTGSETESGGTSTAGDETDLSEGETDVLGLSLPAIPSQPAGTLSTLTAATPRVGNTFLDGVASPGSAISGYSMSTVVGNGSRGKLFEVKGLPAPIPGDLLHPKPLEEEDEEARAYVETALLTKIGCFSGDWIRIEVAPDERLNTLRSWGFNSLEESGTAESEWRVLKVYAFPGLTTKRPRYTVNKAANRRSGSFLLPSKKAPSVYISPITLANLGGPKSVRLSKIDLFPNRRASRQPLAGLTSQYPPVAKEVILQKFSSPAAHEKSLDASIRWGLERHFRQRARIVKQGDLIAIPINNTLGRALGATSAGEDDALQRELLTLPESTDSTSADAADRSVAWFKVGSVSADKDDAESPWGALAVVRAETTHITQVGEHHGRIPDLMHNPWPYYLGTKRLPPPNDPESIVEQQVQHGEKYISSLRRRIRELVSAATSPQAIHVSLPPVAILLVSAQRYIGKATTAVDACSDLGLHCFPVDAWDVLSEGGGGGGDVQTAGLLEARLERGLLSGAEYTALLIKHIDILTADRMTAVVREILARSRVVIATTTNVDKVSDSMRNLFTHEIEMSAPDEGEREGLLRSILQDRGLNCTADVELSSIAMKTAALVAGDLADVVDRAAIACQERLEKLAADNNDRIFNTQSPTSPQVQSSVSLRDVHIAAGPTALFLTPADFSTAVDAARKNFADSIGAPKIPNVTWDDVGGLANVKDSVMETIQLPLERPELFAKGIKKRSGILFYGPPGTGKTLLAKAIATEFSLNFFSVKGPELLNMYIGESEANVRRVFQRARDARPCVVFFDELDSVAPKRGNQGDSGGVMDRIVSQLLAELDGMSSGGGDSGKGGEGVFVIGATNRPDLLDQALLRPGRFDKMLYLGVSDTHEKQLTILEALTRKFTLDPSLSLRNIATSLPLTYTGADLYALCSDAMLKAITRRAAAVDAKVRAINAKRAASRHRASPSISRTASHNSRTPTHLEDADDDAEHSTKPAQPITIPYFFDHLATSEDTSVTVSADDFRAAHAELVPSVSTKELQHYERVRAVFEHVESAEKSASSAHKEPQQPNGAGADADFVLRTGRLAIRDEEDGEGGGGNGVTTNGVGSKVLTKGQGRDHGKGKGKGKVVDNAGADFGFGSVTDGDEGLYD